MVGRAPRRQRGCLKERKEKRETIMEKKKIITITLMLVLLSTVSTSLVFAVPSMPHKFWGDVTVDGVAAVDGLSVEAKINGVTYLSTVTADGRYGWSPMFNVPGDDMDTVAIEGGVAGDDILFYVDGTYAATHVFAAGGSNSLDLAIISSGYELLLYEGWNLIGIPGEPTDPSIAVMLASIIDDIESVWTYNGETGFWSSYSPGAPSDLSEMVGGKGYWIKMTADAVWELNLT